MTRTDTIPKRKAKIASFYACDRCNHPFPKNKSGRKMALLCCTCPRCGGLSDRYMGTPAKLCTACTKESGWEYAVMRLSEALVDYEQQARALNRRDAGLEKKIRLCLPERPR